MYKKPFGCEDCLHLKSGHLYSLNRVLYIALIIDHIAIVKVSHKYN